MSKKKLRPRNKTTGFYFVTAIIIGFFVIASYLLATTQVNTSAFPLDLGEMIEELKKYSIYFSRYRGYKV